MPVAQVVDIVSTDTSLPKVILNPVPVQATALHAWAADYQPLGTLTSWAPAVGDWPFTSPAGKEVTVVNSGGGRALRSDGVDDLATAVGLATNQPVTFVMVARLTAVPNDSTEFIIGRAAGTAFNIQTTTANTRWQLSAGANLPGPVAATPDTNWHVFIVVLNGASSVFQIDTVSVTGNGGDLGITQLRIGAGASSFAAAEYKRLEIHAGAFDATQRETIRAEMAARYGV